MNKKSGFTLVEVFLVTALFGVILIAIFSAYTAGVRIWKSVNDLDLAEKRNFAIPVEKIKKEISSYLRDFEDINFEGDKKEISFPAISGLQIVMVSYSFDKNRKALLRKKRKFSESLKDKMHEEKRELLKADDVDFSYLIYDDAEALGTWVTKFSEEDDQIPKAIKLDIRINETNKSVIIFIPE